MRAVTEIEGLAEEVRFEIGSEYPVGRLLRIVGGCVFQTLGGAKTASSAKCSANERGSKKTRSK